ncbi:dynein axonemal assembly factor 11 isoform X4 [Cotesia glomerata]|uniref:dynein axonemal assembly factor 11 isoform X4 n=1 Tax=Cotesia glomerata TaxID=32391 RepID=UPI001D0198AA|nr:dynein axonemal assembly factor 11 isoform X4 [Cotesia glomerata]
MVRLTEEMVVARSRISDLTAVKKLNCWGSELTDVSILRELKKVEVLSLSVNKINSLADFQYCSNLKDLFVRRNNITDLNEICYLQNLPNLRNLWLEENPCAEREGYRMAVIRALPNLEKLDDKFVTADEINVALSRGKILVHPLSMDASPPQSDLASPERSYDDPHQGHEEYQDTDRRNANYNASSPHQYSQNNHYNYDDYDDRPAVARQNGDYEDRRGYSTEYERSSEPNTHRSQQVLPSPRTAYSANEYGDERRSIDRNIYECEDRRQLDYEEPHQSRRTSAHQNEREDPREMPGWVRHSEKEKCRFHYHRRPVTRNSNILSAVLCLVKELDYPSLEVVEMAVRNRMDELEE